MKRILILSNHSFMLWQFRRELIQTMLRSDMEVVIGVPFGDHIEDFRSLGCKMIDTPLDRRSINPLRDLKLLRQYRQILKDDKPDMVVTYSIKPNVYGGMACRMQKIPYCANVQGLGTAFQSPAMAAIATCLYRRPSSSRTPATRSFSCPVRWSRLPSRRSSPAPASI